MDAIFLLSLLVALAIAAQLWGYDSRDGDATAGYGSDGGHRSVTNAESSAAGAERATIEMQPASLAAVAERQRASQAARTSNPSDEDDSWMFDDDAWLAWESDEDEKAAA